MEKNLTHIEQKALQAMMDPHFIFNVINSIQHFIHSGDKEAANLHLTDFAKLIRISSGFAGKNVVRLEEELAYLKLYLSFEKLRYNENLSYEIIVDKAIDLNKTSIPVMMIQPFLENAIWHGILPTSGQGHLVVKIEKLTESLLEIKIEDDGVGIDNTYLGLNLLNENTEHEVSCLAIHRLKLLAGTCDQDLFLYYSHQDPLKNNKGTMVRYLLPVGVL